ncbi:MAG: prepilin-type N-terminal cleavage/methylation domain-containing protein [Phycisphaerae bacterium]|nr:prepilin-type N-terminal cleavage/methylation domain-containing protein [Phycisphaerae bacterium]
MTRRANNPALRRGFTLLEALVATALLLAVMLMVSEVFSLSSTASGRTAAHAEIIEAGAAFEQAVRHALSNLRPNSLLIIDSPQPLTNRPDVSGNPAVLPLRHDRLVFIVEGAAGEFVSVTDRNRPTVAAAAATPASTHQALVFIGPGNPNSQLQPEGRIVAPQPGVGAVDALLPAKDWIMAERVVLLDSPAFTSFTGEVPPLTYPTLQLGVTPAQGLYACGIDAVTETADELLVRVVADWPNVPGLWELNLCPSEVDAIPPTSATDNYFYYGRAGFNLQARIADLRIEWTDGALVDPNDISPADGEPDDANTQWFGAPRDTSGQPGYLDPPGAAGNRGDVTTQDLWRLAFGEPALPAGVETFDPATQAYRAAWLPATWASRPTALRLTYRVYDSQDRIANVENVDTTVPGDGAPDATLKRYGLEFSFVVSLGP